MTKCNAPYKTICRYPIKSIVRNQQIYKMYLTKIAYKFPTGFAGQAVLNKDPTFSLDGARPPQKYICKI